MDLMSTAVQNLEKLKTLNILLVFDRLVVWVANKFDLRPTAVLLGGWLGTNPFVFISNV